MPLEVSWEYYSLRGFAIALPYSFGATRNVPWIPEVPRKTENGTSGSARRPIVLRIQSEASIPILVYSVIGQVLTGDPHFYKHKVIDIRPMTPLLNKVHLKVSEHEMLSFSVRKEIIKNDNSLV